MKVILIRDVARLGRKSSVVDVPDGHALNFLIPRKMAVPATGDNLKRLNETHKQQETRLAYSKERFRDVVKSLEGKCIIYTTQTNPQGGLFRSVHESDIGEVLKTNGYDILPEHIKVNDQIKHTGVYIIGLAYEGVLGNFSLEVKQK